MAYWTAFHGWMAFNDLDHGDGLTRTFTIGYRFTDDDADEDWTKRFNRFKKKEHNAVRGGAALMRRAVPCLVGKLGLDAARTVFVPALSSHETGASIDGVLWRLTRDCAHAANARAARNAVTKEAHEPLHGHFRADKRREILDEAAFRSRTILNADSVVVFDDFITTGNTLSHIARAVLEVNPDVGVYGIGLGKTERLGYHRKKFDRALSNGHVPAKWAQTWIAGESA